MAKSGTINVWLVDKAPRSNYYWGEGSMYAVANHLTEYFNKVCQHTASPFANAVCTWQKGSVAAHDLVIYFLKSSAQSIISTRFGGASTCSAPSGGTYDTAQGMVSEVYMDAMEGDANYCKLVANLAFHELMHNKLDAPQSKPALRDIHSGGGGGLAAAMVVTASQITPQNIAFMAASLGKQVNQYTASM